MDRRDFRDVAGIALSRPMATLGYTPIVAPMRYLVYFIVGRF
jgi:hypothetical protein